MGNPKRRAMTDLGWFLEADLNLVRFFSSFVTNVGASQAQSAGSRKRLRRDPW